MYLAIQKGINRHKIIGLYSSQAAAEENGRRAIELEPDHYHDIEIIEVMADVAYVSHDQDNSQTVQVLAGDISNYGPDRRSELGRQKLRTN